MFVLRVFLSALAVLVLSTAALPARDGGDSIRTLEVPVDQSEPLSLDGFVEAALVQNEQTTLEDMLRQQSLFTPIVGHDINLGFVRTTAWMRFALVLSPEAQRQQTVFLSITPNFTDELEAYVAPRTRDLKARDFERHQMGDHAPRSRANLSASANILGLELVPGQPTVVYIRARNVDASLNVSTVLLYPSDYEYGAIVQNLMRGAWFGGMGILLVIQFFFFYFDRKKFYIILAMDILAVSSTYFGSLGLARLLFFSEGGLGNDYLTSASSWFGLTAGALSIAGILELRRRYPLVALYFWFAAAAGAIGVICVFAGVNRYFVILAGPVILVLTTLAMIVALLDFLRSRDAQHGLNLAAFGLLWAGLIATNGQRYGVFPLPSWVASSYAATSIIHFTLLTGSLAVRLRNAEAAAREADRRALVAATVAEEHANTLVRERTRELEAARRVAENALSAELQAQDRQVRFMEVISHQYRTPLGVIRTNLESIGLTLRKDDDPNRQRLDRAHRGVARLVEVLEVNLTRSKVQGAAYQPTFLDISVAEFVAAISRSARDLLHGASLIVSMTKEAEDVRISADGEMIRLAVINLLENAFKYSAPVGSTTIWLDVFCEAGEVHLRISDQGIGIGDEPPMHLTGHTVRGANAAHIIGSGVGLSLVKRATDAHGGRFILSTRQGGGTEATIALPFLT
ncbi:sensor histidine kinase [Ensifer sp. ZNC0028]|uniref:sensor histidine kinase n=1 Tax=Ensifer sp. ZNC0028 TaxID=1339236 RepID=UPI0005BB8703|nr:sensor histidine kinase [Ensifer sp. ZNC0028]